MKISLIVAISNNFVIGKDNDLPWHLPADLQYFKKITMGHPVIMGRKNYESIPEKYRPLPGRTNIVLTKNTSLNAPGCEVAHSLPEALKYCQKHSFKEVFIIGGAQVYKQALDLNIVERMYITKVNTSIEHGDSFFPDVFDNFSLTSEVHVAKDEKNAYDMRFCVYDKK